MSDTLDEVATEPHPPDPASPDPAKRVIYTDDESGGARPWGPIIGGLVLLLLLLLLIVASYNTGQLGRLVSTAVAIVAVVGASGALFAASNMLVNQASTSWSRYRTLAGAAAGLVGFGLLRGNRSVGTLIAEPEYLLATDTGPLEIATLDDPDALVSALEGIADPDLIERAHPFYDSQDGDLGFFESFDLAGLIGLIEWPLLGLVLGAIGGWATGAFSARMPRVAVPAVVGVVAGWFIASNLNFANRPDSQVLMIIIWMAAGAVVGWLLGTATHHPAERALMGGAVGAVVGGWLAPELGSGSLAATMLATIIPLGLLGARFGWPATRTSGEVAEFNRRARAFIFLAPALSFVVITLVVPALRTIYTSFLDRESEDFVGLDNYGDLFGAEDFVDTSNWTNLFTSQLFWLGIVLVAAGFLIGAFIHRSRNSTMGIEQTGGSVGPILLGLFLLITAAFTVIRGTFPNTLWWMVTVTVASTVMGLTIAVLAERAGRLESTAKSLVFMPMAISFVGASIIWRFQYQPRNISKDQSGVLNALWIELGKLSHAGWPRVLVLVLLAGCVALTAMRVLDRVRGGRSFAGLMAGLTVLVYLFIELARRSLGGFAFADDGSVIAETVAFREAVVPFNNVYLMFILIWIQSGFAMVILSAAIKAVPEELLEAARIDGATDSQQFFRVILPQIMPTVGVVVTTTLVAVVKVFDIVKVSTGGQFGTNVLANEFFTVAFSFFDRGKGSAIAVIILLTVAPILIMNVRQMQREAE